MSNCETIITKPPVPADIIYSNVGPQGPPGESEGGGVPDGGLEGQVLGKVSDADQDLGWDYHLQQRRYVNHSALLIGEWTDPIGDPDDENVGARNLTCIGLFNLGVNPDHAANRITDTVIIGVNAGASLIAGNGNTIVGLRGMETAVTVNNNTGVGDSALRFCTTGGGNTAVGYACGQANTTGTENVYIGTYCGTYAEGGGVGNSNVFIGAFSGGHDSLENSGAPGDLNAAIGYKAYRFGTGDYNVCIGSEAGTHVAGDGIVVIGAGAGTKIVDPAAQNAVFIGRIAGNSALQKVDAVNVTCIGNNTYADQDNMVMIGDPNCTKTVVRGNVEGCGSISFTAGLQGGSGALPATGVCNYAGYLWLTANASGVVIQDTTNSKALLYLGPSGQMEHQPPAVADALTVNGRMTFEATSDTSLTIKYRGSDGITRSAVLPLA